MSDDAKMVVTHHLDRALILGEGVVERDFPLAGSFLLATPVCGADVLGQSDQFLKDLCRGDGVAVVTGAGKSRPGRAGPCASRAGTTVGPLNVRAITIAGPPGRVSSVLPPPPAARPIASPAPKPAPGGGTSRPSVRPAAGAMPSGGPGAIVRVAASRPTGQPSAGTAVMPTACCRASPWLPSFCRLLSADEGKQRLMPSPGHPHRRPAYGPTRPLDGVMRCAGEGSAGCRRASQTSGFVIGTQLPMMPATSVPEPDFGSIERLDRQSRHRTPHTFGILAHPQITVSSCTGNTVLCQILRWRSRCPSDSSSPRIQLHAQDTTVAYWHSQR